MNALLIRLKEYFTTHTEEKIKEDWDKTAIWDAMGFTWEEYYKELQQVIKERNNKVE